jgi:hypothetical protein
MKKKSKTLETDKRNFSNYMNILKLNNVLLSDQWGNEEIKGQLKKYLK